MSSCDERVIQILSVWNATWIYTWENIIRL